MWIVGTFLMFTACLGVLLALGLGVVLVVVDELRGLTTPPTPPTRARRSHGRIR